MFDYKFKFILSFMKPVKLSQPSSLKIKILEIRFTHGYFFVLYSKKNNPKITILKILVYKIQPEMIKFKFFTGFNFIKKVCFFEHGFVIKLKRIKDLDSIISCCILYTKISRMVIFGLYFLLYFLKLSVGNVFSFCIDIFLLFSLTERYIRNSSANSYYFSKPVFCFCDDSQSRWRNIEI